MTQVTRKHEPMSQEEIDALKRDMNLDSPWAWPIPGSWSEVVARLLVTLDEERTKYALDIAE